ncbi:MAG: AsmA family protein [Rhizobiaceae bacterium]|nr:AsmA family protein [Rhizobiaceae bacterium]
MLKRLGIIIAGLFVLSAIVWLALPYMVSTDLVRERFKTEISNIVGHPVTFESNPIINLWPRASIELNNITIGDISDSKGDALMQADIFSADVSLLSAILGEPNFSNYKLVRPSINFELYPNGSSNWLPSKNLLSGTLETQQSDLDVDIASATGENLRQFLNIGNLAIEGGSLSVITNPGSEPERITSINGQITWTGDDTPMNFNLSAILRGQEVNLDGRNEKPLSFLAGENVAVNVNMKSDMFNLNYVGDIELGGQVFIMGNVVADSPSVRRVLEWSGSEIIPGAALGQVEFEADVSGSLNAAKFNDLIIRIGANRGLGILDFTLPENAPPMINGTLAFNNLDIGTFLRAFTPIPESSDDIADTIDTRFLKQVGLDLRLSAQSANFGPIDMSNLAAGVQVNQEIATFNIGDANAYDGQIFAKVSISEKGIDGGGEISFSSRGVNLGDVLETLAINGPLPHGVGNIDLKLRSETPLWATTVSDIKGSISVDMSEGEIPGLDLDLVKQLAEKRQFFTLEDVEGGSVSFETSVLRADIDGGIARIEKAEVKTSDQMLSLSGIVPFAKGSLALLATLGNKPIDDAKVADNDAVEASIAAPPPLSLFIGGSWPKPIMSPPIPEIDFQ